MILKDQMGLFNLFCQLSNDESIELSFLIFEKKFDHLSNRKK